MTVTISGTSGLTANGSVFTDASGNVGIGTASPSGRLHVASSAGNIPFYVTSSAASQNVRIRLNSSDTASTVAYVWSYSDASLNKQTSIYLTNTGALATQVGQTAGAEPTAGTTAMLIDSSGTLQFNSGYGSAATAYGCRAWVNFSATPTIAASGNVTSVTKNGTGDFTVNFTNAMPDANYSAIYMTRPSSGAIVDIDNLSSVAGPTASAVRVFSGQASNGAGRDPVVGCVSVFR